MDRAAREAAAKGAFTGGVELGAGESNRPERLRDLGLTWAGLDLPDRIRQRPAGSGILLPGDLRTRAWGERLRERMGAGPFLFVAEGVFLFLSPTETAGVFREIREGFPGSAAIFDAVSPLGRAWAPAGARWFVESSRELEKEPYCLKIDSAYDWLDAPREILRDLSPGARIGLRLLWFLRRSHLVISARP